MTRLQPQLRLLSLLTALSFVALPALAQGTAEQREACTPDAIRLCQDTIPDVERTTACMRRHEAELSPRCRAAFLGTGGSAGDGRQSDRQQSDRRQTDRRQVGRDEDVAPAPRPRRARPYDEDQRAVRHAPPRDEDAYAEPRFYRDPGFDEDEYARERVPPTYVEPGVREYRYLTPGGEEARAPDPQDRAQDRARARENVRRLCENGAMDPDTCATTDGALGR